MYHCVPLSASVEWVRRHVLEAELRREAVLGLSSAGLLSLSLALPTLFTGIFVSRDLVLAGLLIVILGLTNVVTAFRVRVGHPGAARSARVIVAIGGCLFCVLIVGCSWGGDAVSACFWGVMLALQAATWKSLSRLAIPDST